MSGGSRLCTTILPLDRSVDFEVFLRDGWNWDDMQASKSCAGDFLLFWDIPFCGLAGRDLNRSKGYKFRNIHTCFYYKHNARFAESTLLSQMSHP